MVKPDDLRGERVAFDTAGKGFDLFRAAVLIGRVDRPELNVEGVLRKVGELTAEVRRHPEIEAPWPRSLRALNQVVFEELGFAGDGDTYDAPENSYLHHVVEKRRGLPIALSVLFCELARRVGIRASGVAFPGHFLVRVKAPEGVSAADIVVDPFHRGRFRAEADLQSQLGMLAGHRVSLKSRHLELAPPQLVLARMLNNLRLTYRRRGDHLHLERVLSRLLLLKPGHPGLLIERGAARRLLLDPEGARADAEQARETSELAYMEGAAALLSLLESDDSVVH